MSSVTKSWAPTKSDPAAAAARKRIILLGVLMVLLVAILAFELPRLMHRSGSTTASPDTAAATADEQPTGLVTDQVGAASQTAAGADATSAQTAASADAAATPTDATSATGATTPVATAPTVSKQVVLAFRHRPAKDPFVPLLGETVVAAGATQATATAPPTVATKPEATAAAPSQTETPAETATVTPATSTPPADTPAPVETPADTATAPATTPETTPETTASTVTPPAEAPVVKPAVVKPDAAVVYANGKKQAVAVNEYFQAGDIWFQLLAVTPKTMKIAVVDGSFTGGKHAITIQRGSRITLVNTATGDEYRLRFTEAAAGVTTTSVAKPTAAATTATQPSTGDTAATTESPSAPATDTTTTTPTSGS